MRPNPHQPSSASFSLLQPPSLLSSAARRRLSLPPTRRVCRRGARRQRLTSLPHVRIHLEPRMSIT